MKPLADRNPFILGAIGISVMTAISVAALQYDKLPFVNQDDHYAAYFADAGGLRSGAAVQVSGFRVGKVSSIELDGPRVLVKFTIHDDIHLGQRTEAQIKTKSVLGAKILDILPRGDGRLTETIPIERTTSPYQLPDALGDLASTINDLDTEHVSQSLQVLAQTFQDTPPDLKAAVDSVARFSQTLDARDTQLRSLLTNANKTTAVLARRTDQVVSLISDTNALLSQLLIQRNALDQISGHLSAMARQLSGLVADNRESLRPALDKLNGVLTIVDNRKQKVQEALKLAPQVIMRLGESLASGPFFKAYVANLIPGQFLQPFIDSAFSDLGLDPNVLAPSQLSDPQTGQRGTPALPVPYPRTGQGGEPNLTLPDAITGNPGDPRYPYREPPPAPPPGGPPPGPPALPPPNLASTSEPTPSPVRVPAPNETAPSQPGQG
ncbi:MCE family protein [Mycobacterium sp. OAE908]|uniref:MCE family protein n=1 Tax=Mycobacterium sp. OAE908 TaxID=2817899 RepID=UPI001AE6ABB3